MKNQLVRAMTQDGLVKAVAISSKELVEEARRIHKTSPTATAALGRVLTATSMIGNMQKIEDGSVTLQIKGDGPLGSILAVSDGVGNVRGYVQNPQISLLEKYQGKLDVGAAVGHGLLTVIRDLRMKEPYLGSVELVSGEIAEDITAYFAQSEQTPTACALGVLIDKDQSVKAAGGYLIQLLPGADDKTIDKIEAGIRESGSVTGMLSQNLSAEAILRQVLGGLDLEILESSNVEYRCYCSRQRVRSTLLLLGREELEEIVEKNETTKISCQFCDQIYEFSPAEISEILEEMKNEKIST